MKSTKLRKLPLWLVNKNVEIDNKNCKCAKILIYIYYNIVVPVNTTLSRHPSGHIRIGDDLAIFCNISIGIAASSVISNSDINVIVSWRKADRLITDQQQTSNGHYDISEVIESNSPGGYMYSSVLSINSLSFADSQTYTCTATISSHTGSFNTTNQVSTIDIQLSKYMLLHYYHNYIN